MDGFQQAGFAAAIPTYDQVQTGLERGFYMSMAAKVGNGKFLQLDFKAIVILRKSHFSNSNTHRHDNELFVIHTLLHDKDGRQWRSQAHDGFFLFHHAQGIS